MLAKGDIDIILECAQRYKIASVILFGSSVKEQEYNDIDVGIKGIEPRLFFKFYAELFKRLSKPVDLIDLSKKSLFTTLVEESGIKIYG